MGLRPGDDPLAVATFGVSELDELPIADAHAALEQFGVIRVRGLFDPAAITAAVRGVAGGFDAARDRKHDPSDTEAIRTNFQKLQIGSMIGGGYHRPLGRFVRILFNPIFADDVLGLREQFVMLARFRNRLYGLPDMFAVFGTDDGLWTASRVHQYPRGGGFMTPHRDALTQLVTDALDVPFAQPFVVLSERGVDYETGGAYFEVDGEPCFYEGGCRPGDVVVYDGRIVHGVADIDPLQPLDLTSFNGRIVAFASLYRHFRAGDDYASFGERAFTRFLPE